MRLVVCGLCIVAAGCGRLGFGERTGGGTGDGGGGSDDGQLDDGGGSGSVDGPMGDGPGTDAFVCVTGPNHDEDGDGVRDACDVCPHIPDSAQADTDGDRVGDACDPEPNNARQSILLFDPFVTIGASWTNGGATQGTDEIIIDARGGKAFRITRSITPTHDLFMIGATTGAGDASTHHISLVTFPNTGNADAYCEMYDNGSSTATQFTWTFDNMTYMHGAPSSWGATRLANGSGTFSYDLDVSQVTCKSTWQSNQRISTAARPAIAAEKFMIYGENLLMRVQYIIIIRTN
ncbi:MAG TPA: thrombospondin type 3 repeat-containing protein [Kofleriaceae bacterium]|nr:thrombospondin type 3 repeat-containing protein [Kofleriaceae bacterium]